jgi:uncharacterized protein (TIGR02001 family)
MVAIGAAGSIFAFSSNAIAQEAAETPMLDFTANITLASDYVFRGISQTNEGPAIQGGFDINHRSGMYVGVWASNTEFNSGSVNGASMEMDFYFGFAGEFANGVGWDVGVLYYWYPDTSDDNDAGRVLASQPGDYDYAEIYVKTDYQMDSPLQQAVELGVYYSDDYFGEDGSAYYLESRFSFLFPAVAGISGISPYFSMNYLDVSGGNTNGEGVTANGYDYFYWAVGASMDVGMFHIDLGWHDASDLDGCLGAGTDGCEAVVFSVGTSF